MFELFWIIEILATFVEGLTCFLVAYNLFSAKSPDKTGTIKIVIATILNTLIISFGNKFGIVSQFNIILAILSMSALMFLIFKEKIINCIMVATTYATAVVILEMFFICLISVITNDPDFVGKILATSNTVRVSYVIFMKAFNLVVYLILSKTLKKSSYYVLSHPIYIISVIIGLVMVMFMMSIINENNATILKIGIAILFIVYLIIIALIIYLEKLLLQRQIKLDEQEYITLKNQILETELENINNLYEKNSKNFHEFNNVISAINLMVNNKQYDEIQTYLSQISNNDKYKAELITGNKIVDMILDTKGQLMNEKNINFDMEIDNLYSLKIKDMDICSILTNLLNNAIEACENLENKEIRLSIKNKANIVVITVVNTCSENLNIKNLISRKKGNHGWGLKIIKDISDKYDGRIDKEIVDGMFSIKIMLFVGDDKKALI